MALKHTTIFSYNNLIHKKQNSLKTFHANLPIIMEQKIQIKKEICKFTDYKTLTASTKPFQVNYELNVCTKPQKIKILKMKKEPNLGKNLILEIK